MARKNEFNLKTRGFDNLLESFDKYEEVIVDNLEEILQEAAEIFLDAAKANVPVNTGDLKRSLEVKTLDIEADQIRIGVGPIGDDAFYWFFVEYGSAHTKAQSYLRPAFDENKEKVKANIRMKLMELIERQGM